MALSFGDLFFYPHALPRKIRQEDIIRESLYSFCEKHGEYDGRSRVTLERILQQTLWPQAGERILAGGALRRQIKNPDWPGDLDFYMLSEKAYQEAVSELRRKGFGRTRESQYVEEWGNPRKPELPPVQLISFSTFVDPVNVIDCNDFTNSMFAFDGEEVFYTQQAVADVRSKILRPHRCMDIARAVLRVQKFVKEGYSLDPMAPEKISNQIQEFNSLAVKGYGPFD